MKYLSEFRDPRLAEALVRRIRTRRLPHPPRLMEFCGGHTVSIFKFGLRELLDGYVELVSGPGCPVCVTANPDIDRAIAMAGVKDVILTTFGDMLRVPGSHYSLSQAKAEGADVRIVYSTLEALDIARKVPDRPVVFLGIGFETTAPTIAASVLTAEAEGLDNYFVYSLHKLCPPVLHAILDSGDINLAGLICPGHVSAIIGAQAWQPFADDFGIPCVVSGFEPTDILQCVDWLSAQVESGLSTVEIAYNRLVTRPGNVTAQQLLSQVFKPGPANWRGIGPIPESGLVFRKKYQRFDAEMIFQVAPGPAVEPKGCLCGDILRGVKTPHDCGLFGKVCTPLDPVGPCMVSSEGSCAAYYHYAR